MNRKIVLSIFATFALIVMAAAVIAGPRATSAADEDGAPHPAHIHSGTCTELGDVVYPLTDISAAMMMDGTPMAAMGHDMDMSGEAIKVEASFTTVPSTLADLLASPYAVNIHESAENIGNYIACGNIGGVMMGTSDLAIGLGELNDSGYSGVATFHDNGDGTTLVSVYLTEEYSDDESGEDTASTTGSTDAAAAPGAIAVDISGFAFNPATLNVKVGDTVTWTNNDSTAHTVTQKPSGSGFQSGTLPPGQSFSFTFDTAGTYDYYCEFHASMSGQVVVS